MNGRLAYSGLSRRRFLQATGAAALVGAFRWPLLAAGSGDAARQAPYLGLAKFIDPGNDEFTAEKEALEREVALRSALLSASELPLSTTARGRSPLASTYKSIGPDLKEAVYDPHGSDIQDGWRTWKKSLGTISRAQFFVLPDNRVRFEVATRNAGLEYRVGEWNIAWSRTVIERFEPVYEQVATASEPWFRDVTAHALQHEQDLQKQFGAGVPYWRSRLDPASGIDIYGSNGIAVGDIDDDGLDEIYISQPGGLPNRLLKVRPDGTAVDLTDKWGVGLLDDTSCALFVDLRNVGKQDLVVLRSSGPLVFVHEGDRYRLRRDAFQFATPPKGGFTGMAAADFDRDGKLDLYLCCYVYFQSEAQYTYASPYHDAQNGPPNFLFKNEFQADGSGGFLDCTAETGMDQNNNRFSFAPAWCDYNGDGWPDLYVANDFGRNNLYRNQNGRFQDVAAETGCEDIGPGMSASWFDSKGDGKPDLYVSNMWTASGQRVIADPNFKPAHAAPHAYKAHTMGNSLFENTGNAFRDVTSEQHVNFGRWAWSSGGHDLDNDGHAELFTCCGMLSNVSQKDLNSFFWRQVVAKSPVTVERSTAYENGWNGINQFIREEYSWSGHEPNVLHAKRGARHYDFSGVSGLDYADDSRAFAVVDFDDDGRPDVVLKSRLGPQLRVLQNNCAKDSNSIAFRLRGTRSNRDGIGARVTVDGQAKWVEAGSGFLSQHSKRLLFGLGPSKAKVSEVEITWPSGEVQRFSNLQAGQTYLVTEGNETPSSTPFRKRTSLPEGSLPSDNSLKLEDTWLLSPVPLPVGAKQGLLTVAEATPAMEIFRRYLFDWRAPLQTPFHLLVNDSNDVIKVYGGTPSSAQVQADVQAGRGKALPFSGIQLKQPYRDCFKFGAAYLWAGMLDESLPYLQKVLLHDPQNARVLTLVGQIRLEQDKADQAWRLFQQAIAADPQIAHAWIGLGDIAAKREQQGEAERNYRKALALDPHSPEAANGLGLALAKQGKLAEAKQLFEQAIQERKDYADAINNLAVLFVQQGKVDDALAAWNYGIGVAPEESMLYLNLGRAYISLGQTDKAKLTMQRLLERDPNNATAVRALQELSAR